MERYSWPGNVRELEHAIQRGVALLAENANYLRREHLVPLSADYRSALEPQEKVHPLKDVIRESERRTSSGCSA